MTSLFISDLHLDPSRPATVRAFLRFLDEKAAAAEALYILGDCFEAWVGDDDDAPLARQIVAALAAYSANHRLYFMVGNRDFLVGNRFGQETGATLLNDPTVIELYGTRVLLMHGDSLCTRDRAYMQFRAQARNLQFQEMLLSKSLHDRRLIAQQLRLQSQSMNSLKAADIMDVTPEEVVQVMQEYRVKTLIHGHTHRPARHKVDLDSSTGERIVLGDWCEKLWWIEADTSGLRLCEQVLDV
jgi:UDP-2,3-diacylglucosamine hydrolase